MRAVLALLGLVGLVAAGFVIARTMFPPEPVTATRQTGEGTPARSQQRHRTKITISRARRAERRVTPYATLLPAPVAAALSEPVPPVVDKSRQPVAPPPPEPAVPGSQPGSGVSTPTAVPAVRPPPAPLAEKPVPPPPAGAQTAEKSGQRFRLPYAKATQPSPGDHPRKAAPAGKRESSRYRRAIPESPGVVKTATKKIHLAGVEALAHDALCKLPSGETWPCGRIGTLSLRRLIRSRSIVCDILQHLDDASVLARCTVARVDINKWVVRNGWARPAGSGQGEFADAFETAKQEKKGQWRETSPVNN